MRVHRLARIEAINRAAVFSGLSDDPELMEKAANRLRRVALGMPETDGNRADYLSNAEGILAEVALLKSPRNSSTERRHG